MRPETVTLTVKTIIEHLEAGGTIETFSIRCLAWVPSAWTIGFWRRTLTNEGNIQIPGVRFAPNDGQPSTHVRVRTAADQPDILVDRAPGGSRPA